MSRPRCFCGCGAPAVIQHHAVYQQQVRRTAASLDDPRNLVWVAHRCHERHHSRTAPFTLAMLPDAVYEFAAEALGAGPAYNYLARRYAGSDDRLAVMLNP